jgi:hypothetical protein
MRDGARETAQPLTALVVGVAAKHRNGRAVVQLKSKAGASDGRRGELEAGLDVAQREHVDSRLAGQHVPPRLVEQQRALGRRKHAESRRELASRRLHKQPSA